MKKSILFLITCLITLNLSAQDSNVLLGLGSPAYGVKIKNNFPGGTGGFARAFMLSNQDASVDFLGLGVLGFIENGVSSFSYGYIGTGYDNPYMTFIANGNIGVGTYSPQSKLHIAGIGSNKDGGNSNRYNSKGFIIEAKSGGRSATVGAELEFVIPANTDGSNEWGQGRILTVAGNSSSSDATGKMIIGTRRMFDKNGTGQEWFYGDDIVIDGIGNIGIGTITPNSKLAVNGNIRAKEIKVETANWPDYVFAKDYKLPTLQETEKHIKDKGHLPGIPSASEVKANGVDLGEMNAKLLQKIEELTLHLIEMKRENTKQREDINELKSKL